MTVFLSAGFLIVGIAILLPSLYLFLLTIVSFLHRFDRRPDITPRTRFAVIVPAHDEEFLIPQLMASLTQLDYPHELYDTYVVADNCTDSTAKVSRQLGAFVYERADLTLQGKPHALKWLVEKVIALETRYDAFAFVDADSVVSSNFLSVIDAKFQSGSRAVQVHYAASNPGESSVAALRYAGFQLMNFVRPLAKHVLGLPSGLFGTGMAFDRSVVENRSWDALTLAEDVEFFVKLVGRGIMVEFAPEAQVISKMPESLSEARSQNLRWERGRLYVARKYGLPILLRGILERNAAKLVIGAEQLIPPLSALFAASLMLLITSLLIGKGWMVTMGLVANLALFGHLFLGLASSRAPLRVYQAFAYAPWFIAWKLLLYAQAFQPGTTRWVKTNRSQK